MAVEKDKVLAKLEVKFKGKSLSKTFKDNIAAKWAAKIENEDDIDTYIEDNEEVILEAASEADRRATEAAKKAAEKQKQEPTPTNEPNPDDFKDAPEWMKAYMKKQEEEAKALKEKLEGFEKAQQTKSIQERFKSDERLKGIPEFMFKGRIPQSEDDFETAVTELVTDYDSFAQERNITRFGKDNPAGNNKGGDGKTKPASKEEVDAVAQKMGI